MLKTYEFDPSIKERISDSLKEYYKTHGLSEKQKQLCGIKKATEKRKQAIIMVSCEEESYGTIIAYFNSQHEAAYKTNIHQSTVSDIVNFLQGKEYKRRIFNNNEPPVPVGWTLVRADDYEKYFKNDKQEG